MPVLRSRGDGKDFNSRSCVRGDTEENLLRLVPLTFQLTPLREGRPAVIWSGNRRCYFNSRPCVRGDALPCVKISGILRFQLTPLCEGRLVFATGTPVSNSIFQLAPLREGRRRRNCLLLQVYISTHAPA